VTLRKTTRWRFAQTSASARIESVLPLGFKDHDVAGQGLDPSDRDGAHLIRAVARVRHVQPGLDRTTLKVRNEVFLLTANEGDGPRLPTPTT